MGKIFGGGDSGDDGAAAMAAANERIAQNQIAANAAAAKLQSEQIAKDKAEALMTEQRQDAKRQADIEVARREQADQQKAQSATGSSPSFEDTRSDTAKAMAMAKQTGTDASLPGFNSLANRVQQQPGQGFAGQSNSLSSQTGFNTGSPGGRRYV